MSHSYIRHHVVELLQHNGEHVMRRFGHRQPSHTLGFHDYAKRRNMHDYSPCQSDRR